MESNFLFDMFIYLWFFVLFYCYYFYGAFKMNSLIISTACIIGGHILMPIMNQMTAYKQKNLRSESDLEPQ